MVCRSDNRKFWNWNVSRELQSGDHLAKSVYLLLRDALYIVRHQHDHQRRHHDVLNTNNIKSFCKLVENILKHGGHEYIFCSPVEFAFSWSRFRARKEWLEEYVGEN